MTKDCLIPRAPISAGQYFWVSMLAPPSAQRFLSYMTGMWEGAGSPREKVSNPVVGWMTVLGWQALVASTAYISGTLIQAVVVLTTPSYEPHNWHGTLIVFAVLCWGMLINTSARKLLPVLEGPILCVHILGFFGVLVPLVVLSSHRASSDVWGAFENAGGWPTEGLSTMIGLLMSIFLFTGVDGAIHVCYPHLLILPSTLICLRCQRK